MKLINLILILCSSLFFIHCKADSGQSTIEFNVDKTLLGEDCKIDSLNFIFSVPSGWVKMDEKILTQARQQLKQQSNTEQGFTTGLLEFYLDSLSGSFCSLSRIYPANDINNMELIKRYRSDLQQKYQSLGIKEGDFVINQVKVSQFLVMTDEKVLFKLLLTLKDDSFLQIDYAIDQNIYAQYINKVESSIGSINLTK